MLRLLEMTYADLAEVFAERFGKGPFLAGALYREFYKKLNPQAWQAAAIAGSPGLPDRLRQALAFEPGDQTVRTRPPRPPREPIFNRIMIERTVVAAAVMGCIGFALFNWALANGWSENAARNGLLMLMVLFENVHVFNCRSETRSIFQHSPMRNRILLFGTLAAQLIHIGAMYTPWINDVLGIQPVTITHWFELLALALTVTVVMELHKLYLAWCGRTGSRYSCRPRDS